MIRSRVGVPPDRRVSALVEYRGGTARLGSVKTPKQVEVWTDLPRSKLGKILKNEVKSRLLSQADHDRH